VRKNPKLSVVQSDGEIVTPPAQQVVRKDRVLRPKTPRAALAACSKLYVEARRGEMDTQDATRLAFVLKTCSSLHEDAEVVPKLAAIEERLDRLDKLFSSR
jgi:hypothetical protein